MMTLYLKYIAFLALFFSLAGCSTHATKVVYEGDGSGIHNAEPVVGQIVVSDQRGTDSNWLGAIRGGYGNRLKTLRTERSTDQVVDEIYTTALTAAGIYASSEEAPFQLNVDLTKFDCSYYFNREAHAHVNVSLQRRTDSSLVFRKVYKTDLAESGVGAGIFGDVDTLRDLAEQAMNETVDKMLNDSEFEEALGASRYHEDVRLPEKRLEELKSLYERGLISADEYEQKRTEILSTL
jgi:ABC-type uncharacterized transport system auxiliary subunit